MQDTPSNFLPLDSGAIDTDAVLGHVAWLRRLARALVRDDASADDLVQDAVGVAFAAQTPIRDLRGFLAGTVRRLAARVRRTDVRRVRREQERAADAGFALPATDELAERVDTLRIVLEELRELPRAQQRVVSLRYLEDLDATEIAQREGTSLSTVRSHLARGIAALRERLDRRAGGRDAWCAVLAPWALPGTPPVPGPGSEIPVSDPTTALHAAGLTGAAIGATGVLAMTIKAAAISLVPLALAGVWYVSGDHDVELDATLARSTATDEGAGADLADVTPRSGVPREVLPAEVPAGAHGSSAGTAPSADPTDLPAGFARIEGQAVDALTGEAVPYLDLIFVDGEPDENGMKHSVSVTTDEHGYFKNPFESLPVGTVEMTPLDAHGGVTRRPHIQRLTFPLEEPVEVRVGPTFSLGLPSDLDLEATRYTVSMHVPANRRRDRLIEAVVRIEDHGSPWVRFSNEVLDVEGTGPWALSLRSQDGLTRGQAEVSRKSGVEPGVVYLDIEDCGSIAFHLTLPDDVQLPAAHVDVWPVGEEANTRRVFLREHHADGTIHGTYRFAATGRHEWEFGVAGASMTGEVNVTEGEIASVQLSLDDVGPTFGVQVLIDVTAVPGVDPSKWQAYVTREDDPSNGFLVTPARDDSDPDGFWRVALAALADGRWIVAINPGPDVVLEPKFVHVGPGEPAAVVVVKPAAERTEVAVSVVDAITGDPIRGAEAAYVVSLSDAGLFMRDGDGGFAPEALPADQETTIIVRAPGYQAQAIQHQPSRDGRAVEAKLTRGWANRVMVLEMQTLQFVAGVSVFVDGSLAGKTDAGGALMIAGDGPPDLVEVGTDDPAIRVVGSPFDAGQGDDLMGYMFFIEGR